MSAGDLLLCCALGVLAFNVLFVVAAVSLMYWREHNERAWREHMDSVWKPPVPPGPERRRLW